MVAEFLVKTDTTVQERAMMYKVVVHMVFLYGINSWVVTDAILKLMEVFHHKVSWFIARMASWQVEEGGW